MCRAEEPGHKPNWFINILTSFYLLLGDDLFNTSCEMLSKINTEILKKNVVVRFEGEPGVVRCSSTVNKSHKYSRWVVCVI